MNQTIWKYETLVNGEFKNRLTIKMPIGSKILCVQTDQKTNIPCIWALVYPENELEERYFELFGTGYSVFNDMGVDRVYIGTYQYQKGEFVGHLFERL